MNGSTSDETTTGSSDSVVNTLRVAKAELSSGNVQGKVFCRLSEGAVAFQTERSEAIAKVSRDLQQVLLEDSPVGSK